MPSSEVVVGGDLLSCAEPWLGQQCNCVTTGARGLAKAIFDRHPAANVYTRRLCPSTPGTVDVTVVGQGTASELRIVALFAQRAPGKGGRTESAQDRLGWLATSLAALAVEMDAAERDSGVVKRLALPYNLGCGLAGGSWPAYRSLIDEWADSSGVVVRYYDRDRASTRGDGQHRPASRPGRGRGKRKAGDQAQPSVASMFRARAER